MVYLFAKYVIASLLLLPISTFRVFGSDEQIKEAYSKSNTITRISIESSVLEYTWIKNNSCSNTNVVLDHELLEDSLNHSIRVVKINLKLIDKGGGLCAQQYYGEQEAHVDLSQKLKEVAKEYSLQPDKASDSEGIYGFLLRNGQLHLVYRQPIIFELTLPTVTLRVE